MAATIPGLSRRWDALRAALDAACARAGRDPAGVRVVAVTKSAGEAVFDAVRAAGLRDVGESRVQAARVRRRGRETDFRWHLVGHLQSNKARLAVELFDVLHGIDAPALLRRVDDVAHEAGRAPRLFLQVNVSGEASKHGLRPEALPEALAVAAGLRAARVVGLMTMAPAASDPERARPIFAALRRLAERHRDPGAGLPLSELSMGMSEDCEIAVEEGATCVRVGRRLVGEAPAGGTR